MLGAHGQIVRVATDLFLKQTGARPEGFISAIQAASPRGVRDRVRIVQENLEAANVEPSAGDVRDIDGAAGQIEVKGTRLPEAVFKFSNP